MKGKSKKESISKIFSIIFKLLYYIVISFVCLIAVFLIFYIVSSQLHSDDENYKPSISLYTIVSPSMTPNINVYDVVVNVGVDSPKDIKMGDIITFKSTSPTSEGMTITHRVVGINELPDGKKEYMTQGDNNSEPDSVYVTFDNVIGKEIITIPKIGYIQFLLANQKGWLFLVLIPLGIYLLKELFRLIDLLGLRRRVDKVIGVTEESVIEQKTNKEHQEKLKVEIQEKQLKKEAKKDSYVRSEHEQDGFLEKYNETVVKVKVNKYQKYKKNKEVETDRVLDSTIVIPTKVSADNVEIKKKKTEDVIELPKVKEKPLVNEQYEILDTDDLSTKIKEYDSKIEQLDKMLKDIENINPESVKENDRVDEVDDFLQARKIKVTKIEETKNKKATKVTTPKKRKNHLRTKDVEVIATNMIVPFEKKTEPEPIEILEEIEVLDEPPKIQDIKELRKEILKSSPKKSSSKKSKSLNLNPQEVKKINRKPKEQNNKPTEKNKLNLNSKNIKKINRPGKKKVEDTTPKKPKVELKKDKLISIVKKKK